MKNYLKFFFTGILVANLLVTQIAWAGFVPSTKSFTDRQAESQRSAIMQLIDREDVRTALINNGVTPDEAKQRLAYLSPDEVNALKTRIDTLPAGGNAVGIVVGALLLVFLILLFTDLLGATDVYDFDKHHHHN